MKHLLIILSFLLLLSSPLFGQSKPLGVVLPPTVMGNVSSSRKQILLNTLDEEVSQYFDVSPPTNVSSGDLPVVSDVFHLQIIEEDGDTQLSVRWMSGNERKVETNLCGGCKTIELNGKLKELVGKLFGGKKVEPVLVVEKWTKQLGTSSNDSGYGVTTDPSGNIYLTGTTNGGLDGNTNSGKSDIVLIKYNSLGTKQWTKQLGTSSSEGIGGITFDTSGNIYVTGTTWGGLDGNNYLGGNNLGGDIFIMKYSSDGIKLWVKQFGTSYDDFGGDVTTDSSGNIYLTGSTGGGLDGNTNSSESGESDIVLIKFNSSGTKQWTKQMGTSVQDDGLGVTTDSSGNIYVIGGTWGGLDGNTSSGQEDIFLIKYNSSGTKQWTKQMGTSQHDLGYDVTTDSSGNIYLTGETVGGLDGNTNSGGYDIFLIKFNSSGTKQWTKQMGTSSHDMGFGVTTDSSDNIYVTGLTYGGLDGNINKGYSDIFLIKFNSSGTKQWTKQLGDSSKECISGICGFDSGRGVTTDSSGNIYVTGTIDGVLDGNKNLGSDDIFLIKYNSSGIRQ